MSYRYMQKHDKNVVKSLTKVYAIYIIIMTKMS